MATLAGVVAGKENVWSREFMTMFKASFYCEPSIQAIEIARTTESSVFLTGGRSERRKTDTHQWCGTWEQAKDACINRFQLKVDQAKATLRYYEAYLTTAKEL